MELLDLSKFFSSPKEVSGIITDWTSYLFKMIEEDKIYPFDIINQWIVSRSGKNDYIERYTSLKMVDRDTFNSMYQRLFNPVTITKLNKSGNICDLKCMLYSIDDAAYGFGWENLDQSVVSDRTLEIISWIDSIPKDFNFRKLLEYGLLLGAKDISW